MARIYTAAGEYANAEKALADIMLTIKQQEALFWEAKAYYYLALLKAASGQTAESESMLSKAQVLSKKIGAQALYEEIGLAFKKQK